MTKTLNKKADFTEGPLFSRLLMFALPVMATSALQILYNAADKFIVGQFSGDDVAVGAIGTTDTTSAFIINMMIGIGAGAGILISQLYGAKRDRDTSRAVHTAMSISVVLGVIFTVIGMLAVEPLLRLLGTRETFLESAVLYLRIVFIGILPTSVYNFGASILRAVGDSKSPLIIGASTGLLNVALNIVFVAGFGMSVAGVAIATVTSQYASAAFVVLVLMSKKGESYALRLKDLCFDSGYVKRILALGLPTGLQSSCFTLSNMMMTAAGNTFADHYVTARSVASNIDGWLDCVSGSFMHSTMASTGQNYGAGKRDRVIKTFFISMAQGVVLSLSVAMTLYVVRADFAGLFVDINDPHRQDIINATAEWTGIMLPAYFIQAMMNVVIGSVRGMGMSLAPMIANIVATCGGRALWIYVIFPNPPFNTFAGLAMLYPFSWMLAVLFIGALAIYAFIKLAKVLPSNSGDATEDKTEKSVST